MLSRLVFGETLNGNTALRGKKVTRPGAVEASKRPDETPESQPPEAEGLRDLRDCVPSREEAACIQSLRTTDGSNAVKITMRASSGPNSLPEPPSARFVSWVV